MSLTIATIDLKAVYFQKLADYQRNKDLLNTIQLVEFFESTIPAESNYLSEFIGTGRVFAEYTAGFKQSQLTLKQHFQIGGLTPQCKVKLTPEQRQQLQQLL